MRIWSIIYSQEFIMTMKLLLALLCGGILGMEREQKKRPAGFRTYMLVCVGATLVMITNQFLGEIYPDVDPTRMGAQVISGIGFLGVGTIIVTGDNRVRGLTTAAGLWATACVGLAIGAGIYYAAFLVTILIFITMSFLQILDNKISKKTRVINVYLEFEEITDVGKFIRRLRSENVKIYDMEIKSSKKTIDVCTTVIFSLSFPTNRNHKTILDQFHEMEGVLYAEEIG